MHLIESLTAYEAWFYAKTIAALSGAEKRAEVISKMNKPFAPSDIQVKIAFDQNKVGYRYIGMAYKSSTGKLRTI